MSDQPDRPPDPAASRSKLRPLAWLGTLSTVVAVATGMFTLRDQILPSDSGNAMASTASYQQAVVRVCDALNQITSEQPADVAEESQAVHAARTALAQRNAVLSSWKQALGDSQQELAAFEGLNPPRSLLQRERITDRAWNAIVMQERLFVEQLEDMPLSALPALIRTIPAVDASVAREAQTRSAGLTNLGGADCELSPPTATPIVTLPALAALTVQGSGSPGKSLVGKSSGATNSAPPGQPVPPVNPPSKVSPPVNPPLFAAPAPPHVTGTVELAPSGLTTALTNP
jgi:hypothetical protein